MNINTEKRNLLNYGSHYNIPCANGHQFDEVMVCTPVSSDE